GNARSAAIEKRAANLVQTSKIVTIGMCIVLIAIVVAILLVIIRNITCQVRKVMSIADSIAGGDLSVEVQVTSTDETGQLLAAMKTMADNLRTIISQVSSTSSQVATAANQLHTTAERIATGAEEVAAQTGTVATAGEEMSATSGDIAQNCQFAAEGAQLATQSAS